MRYSQVYADSVGTPPNLFDFLRSALQQNLAFGRDTADGMAVDAAATPTQAPATWEAATQADDSPDMAEDVAGPDGLSVVGSPMGSPPMDQALPDDSEATQRDDSFAASPTPPAPPALVVTSADGAQSPPATHVD